MYKIERQVLEEAPEIQHNDVMSLTEAASVLGVSVQAIDGFMARGKLTTVVDEGSRTAYGNPRRLVLRTEVDQLRKERAEEIANA